MTTEDENKPRKPREPLSPTEAQIAKCRQGSLGSQP
jgi:hypothetical protein